MITYLDTSAAVKRLRTEVESGALAGWLQDHPEAVFVSSRLMYTELHRIAAGYGITRERTAELLAGVHLVELTPGLLAEAAFVPAAPGMRLGSMDALHLVSARLTGVEHILTYDDQLAAAAEFHGMTVHAPS